MASFSLTFLRRAFVDICRGYSLGRTKDSRAIHIRHLGHKEHADFEDIQAGFEQRAKAQGALTEAQRLAQLYAKGQWSPEREADIERQRASIARMEEGRKTIAVPSILRSHDEHIARERDALIKTLTERSQVIGTTAELDAQRRLEDYYLVNNVFTDSALTQALYTSEDFDSLSDDDVNALHDAYRIATEPCSDVNLRRLAVQDFFVSYWALAGDNAQTFFGRPICDLTYYQVRLCNQARYWKSLLDNVNLSTLTPEQRTDPDVLEQKMITQANMEKMRAEGKVPVGMDSKDIKETGQQFSPLPPPGISGVDLVKWMKKNQGLAR